MRATFNSHTPNYVCNAIVTKCFKDSDNTIYLEDEPQRIRSKLQELLVLGVGN